MSINDLNANPDPRHFSYKVLGLLSWAVLVFCFVSLIIAKDILLNLARLVSIYMMMRFIIFTVFYLAGLAKIRETEKRVGLIPAGEPTGQPTGLEKEVHHLVVIPNFKEPADILSRTLKSLAATAEARHQLTVVLGMEEREPAAADKAEALLKLYQDSFFCIKATFHPADLPGEVPGKGTNETWAVRIAREDLVDRQGIPLESIVVTVIDSDSIIHPKYFTELTHQFANSPQRYTLIWQAPILLDNDIRQTQAFIRLLTYFSNAISNGDYMNPWEVKFPLSTYSVSLKLLEEVNFWDPTVIAEDVNIFMRAFFKKGGQASIKCIYLPVHGNPVYGVNLWQAMGIFFNQKVRQGFGGAEVGYLIQKWNYPTGTPCLPKVGRFIKLVHDHLFFSTAGFIVTLGTLLSIMIDHSAIITLPPGNVNPVLFIILNLLGGSSLFVIWFSERWRLRRGKEDRSLKCLLGEIVSLALFPALFFLLVNLPGLLAQTRMMLGQPLYFKRTPKGFKAEIGE